MKYPISEIFGPTIQGEGPLLGHRTYFIRFRGCDFDCSWCDTKYAVLPKYSGWESWLGKMEPKEILERLINLGWQGYEWITLSGGNPALFVDAYFCEYMKATANAKLAIETQGSREMAARVVDQYIDSMVVSPKPPSSGMHEKADRYIVESLLRTRPQGPDYYSCLKYVIFDQTDLEWAYEFDQTLKNSVWWVPRYLSVGTPLDAGSLPTVPGLEYINPDKASLAMVRGNICNQMAWLFDVVAKDNRFSNWIVTPQSHTLAWGQKRGK